MPQSLLKLECSRWYTIANTRFFTFDLDLGVMVTQNVAKYPSHHVAHGPGKLEVSNHTVKEMHLKEKKHSLNLTLVLKSHYLWLSTFYVM